MNKFIRNISLILALSLLLFSQACVETEDLVTPNVAAPVLILLEGTSFPATSTVSVNSKTLELDKTNILDHNLGIDSIPVPNLALDVYVASTRKVASLTTNAEGNAELVISWADLGIEAPTSGTQVRLEFAGTHKSIAFRKYHTVRVQ
ncbi:hypothetical protein J0A67_20355 [Algoriphagus aestuariicola]|uniref:Uncharacterized protein n=1 Tax=Algoriphagus aestuariicola TaxID=1852016 RepID=A0ABS3BWP8_9BACT|nr:hypothetical protein [Algoriphagus aestuariicola]MBN7803239.1 hypothetical protein [Algoriphagus aestuariicola]